MTAVDRAGAATRGTVRAAVLTRIDEPVALEPLVLDRPGPDDVRLRVAGCGVCHTDLHVMRGERRTSGRTGCWPGRRVSSGRTWR